MSLRNRILVLVCLFLALPVAGSAFDCTPLGVLSNDGTAIFNTLGTSAVPGEPLCGKDYTGWDSYVYQFTIGADALQLIYMAIQSAAGETDLILLDQCEPNSCVHVSNNPCNGQFEVQDPVCLAATSWGAIKTRFWFARQTSTNAEPHLRAGGGA